MKEEIKNLQAYLNAKHQKEKLSSERVELGLVQDADRAIADFFQSYDTAVSAIKGALQSLRGAGVAFEKADGKASNLEDFKSKLEQSAKELGVSGKDWAVTKDIDIALKTAKEVAIYIKTINKAISSL